MNSKYTEKIFKPAEFNSTFEDEFIFVNWKPNRWNIKSNSLVFNGTDELLFCEKLCHMSLLFLPSAPGSLRPWSEVSLTMRAKLSSANLITCPFHPFHLRPLSYYFVYFTFDLSDRHFSLEAYFTWYFRFFPSLIFWYFFWSLWFLFKGYRRCVPPFWPYLLKIVFLKIVFSRKWHQLWWHFSRHSF